LVLNTYIEGYFGNLVEVTQKEGLSLIETEKEAFGIDHAELGGIIAETWQFPSALTNSIQNHHKDRSEESVPNIEAWVRLSNLVYYVSLSRSVYSHHKGITCQIGPAVLSRFGLKQKDIEEVTLALPSELKKIEGLLKIAL
jgi:HD-like signal output (HDOD) protein